MCAFTPLYQHHLLHAQLTAFWPEPADGRPCEMDLLKECVSRGSWPVEMAFKDWEECDEDYDGNEHKEKD